MDTKYYDAPALLARMQELMKKLDEFQASLPRREESEKSTQKEVG